MIVKQIAKGDPVAEPGKWRTVTKADGTRTARMSCPKCGSSAVLLDHEIASDGTVTPSVECIRAGCTFHENVRLIMWGSGNG